MDGLDPATAPGEGLVDAWTSSGLSTHVLPSGFQVRLRLPQPRDLIVRGILAPPLVKAVIERGASGAGFEQVAQEDPELTAKLLEAMRTLAADSIRQARKSDDEPWHPVTVSPQQYGMIPDEDQDVIEGLVMGAIETTADTREGREEAAGTVNAYADFRDRPNRAARRAGRKDVRAAAIDDDRAAPSDRGPQRRSRARHAPREG